MTEISREILDKYQIRKTGPQKSAFIAFMKEKYPHLRVESGGFPRSRNLVVGDPDRAKVIFCAHYDTCAALPFPNLIMPKNIPLSLLYAVSWQSWTAVNGDGVLDRVDGELVTYYRYYAYKQFSAFIKPGMVRVEVMDSFEENSTLATVAFTDGEQTVIVIVNNETEDREIRLSGVRGSTEIYRTDETHNCEQIHSGEAPRKTVLPAKSITTIVYG